MVLSFSDFTFRRKPRLALLSPLPPDRSDFAEYAAAICEPLSRLVELHVFTETSSPAPLPKEVSVRPLDELPRAASRFDRIIGVVANSPLCRNTLQYLRRYGDAFIVYDSYLLTLYLEAFGKEGTLALAARELGREVAYPEIEAWSANQRKAEATFLGEIMGSNKSVILHSAVTSSIATARFGFTPTHLPLPVWRAWREEEFQDGARRAARRRLGLQDDDLTIVALGFVRPHKMPVECIEAIEMLRRWGLQATLHFAGSCEELLDEGESLRGYAASLGVGDAVRWADGYLPEQSYRDYLVGSDLALVVRSYDFGGVSGALLDCAAAGLPTVTTLSLGAAAGMPPELTRTIPDHLSPVLMAEALAELAEAGPPSHPEAIRRAFCEARNVGAYGRRLCDALTLPVPAAAA